jgi:hypothetical protein
MMPIEDAIVETLRRSGPCCLDDVVASLPNFSWGEVFASVDRMSRHGRILLHQVGFSAYQIALHSQFVKSSSTSSRGGGRHGNESRGGLSCEVEKTSGVLALCASGPEIERAVLEMERN